MQTRSLSVGLVLLLTLLVYPAAGGWAQVQVEDLGYHQAKPIEPGADAQMDEGTPAALGDGIIVFEFKLTDIDPIADDPSDVSVECIQIQNLGSATGGTGGDNSREDIVQVMVLDQDGNSFAPPDNPDPIGNFGAPPGDCDRIGQTEDNALVRWEAYFEPNRLVSNNQRRNSFIIPDDGSETFRVAVRTDATDFLEDHAQNHTLMLRATVVVREEVGSPILRNGQEADNFFVETVLDSEPEVIWNGGLNRWTEDSWVINPVMPGQTAVVGRFTVCDRDANEDQVVIRQFFVKQDEDGTALSSDITMLKLYRVEGFTRTLVASRVPNATFERGNPTVTNETNNNNNGGLALPAQPTFIVLPDDTCYTFELEADVSPFATKGHLIKPRFQLTVDEPAGTVIDHSVDPEIRTRVGTLIGKGLLELPETRLIGKPGIVPLRVRGVELPGFGTLQVGPRGKLQYDPRVIHVKSIRGVAPYVVDASEIDNRRGEARFTVRYDVKADLNDDGKPDNPLLNAFQEGTVAEIFVEPTGQPNDRTRLVLTYDCFELIDQMSCPPTGFPNPGVPNQNPNNDISVSAGEVVILYPGDVDFDGQPTITDALKVANAILPCMDPTPHLANLDEEQRSVADVASPFAEAREVPTCDHLTSADVAEIARLAINFGINPAPSALAAGAGPVRRTWYAALWSWLSGRPPLARVSFDGASLAVSGLSRELGGVQGRVTFDPASGQVLDVQGLNGYTVLAASVDNAAGEVRFLALAPRGSGLRRGQLVRLSTTGAPRPTLSVEALVDEDGAPLPFVVSQEAVSSRAALSLERVQLLPQRDGALRLRARGTGIQALQVQVYDLAGAELFDRTAPGDALVFAPLAADGRPLANGVYLVVITAHGQGQSVRGEVKKLVILR